MDAETTTERALVLGLGNPGREYVETRHNLGYRVVDVLARRWRIASWREECAALVAAAERADLAKPQTFMNRSGHAARCLVEHRGYPTSRILVVFDDVSLPLGSLRLRPGGSPGGHRGLESVIASLRTDRIARLRLGIAPPEQALELVADLSEFVLGPFDPDEADLAEREVERAASACESWLESGVEVTMNRFNGPLPAEG